MIISNNINNDIKQKQTSIGQNKQEKKRVKKKPQEILIDAETQSFIYTETPLKPENWKT